MKQRDAFGRRRLFAVAISAVALCACADTPLEQPQLPARFSIANNGPTLHSNSQRYREQHVPHATGRSGSASLTARALLDRSGQTIVELTTGQLDQLNAPGSISKVQLKLPAAATQTFNGLNGGGTWSRTFPRLMRHERVQAQANVRSIDGERNDVITITERVNLRPDLSVLSVGAPSSVAPGTITIIGAVAELNGDVGATGNCVLYIDGTEADRSNNVWVADGDQVSCAFSHTFNTLGSYTVRVAIESVVPGDWDATNNAAAKQVAVVDPVLHGSADLQDWQRDTWEKYESGRLYDYPFGDDIIQSYASETERHERSQYASVYGSTPADWGTDFTAGVVLKSNGAMFASANASSGGSNCAYSWSPGFNIESCSTPTGSYVQAYRWGGVTWYLSQGYFREWRCYYVSTPYFHQTCTQTINQSGWSSGNVADGGGYVDLGDDVSFDIDVQVAGGGSFTGAVTVTFNPWNILDQFDEPWYCEDVPGISHFCRGSSRFERERTGSGTF